MNLTDEDAKFTSDLGLFVGLGGKELFKNFYIGANLKLINVIHLNLGLNLREYEVLKSGFAVGDQLDPGTSIPFNNEWKVNFYFGLTFDFDLVTGIMKK